MCGAFFGTLGCSFRILLKYAKELENPSLQSLLIFHSFAQLSKRYVKTYAATASPLLVLKHQNCERIKYWLSVERGSVRRTESTSPSLCQTTSPVTIFLSFTVHHPQIESEPAILNNCNDNQDERLFVGETISYFAVKKFYTYNILGSNGKKLPEEHKSQPRSQLPKNLALLIALWRNTRRVRLTSGAVFLCLWVIAIVPGYHCSQLSRNLLY
jgi:hypothetical protein